MKNRTMDLDRLHQRLVDAGRAQPPPDAVPYGFSGRIMARIRERQAQPDPWQLWNSVLWRAAAPALALMVVTAAISWWQRPAPADADSLAYELEAMVCAPLDLTEEAW